MTKRILFCLALMMLAVPATGHEAGTDGFSHSGGTDKCGCHFNRSTGEYHCHTRKQRGGDCPAALPQEDGSPD